MDSSQSSRERTCPSCSAPAEPEQRWCLECGAELPQPRRPALRSAVGIATTLAVLVGAASAGGYTLLQDGKEPPPPAQTIAQTPPAPPTPTVPPADGTPPPVPTTPAPAPLPDAGSGGGTAGGGGGGAVGGTGGTSAPPADTPIPDLSGDLGEPSTEAPPDDDTELNDDGGVVDDGGSDRAAADREPRPRLRETNLVLGGIASVYAPYGESTADYGDASKLVDGTPRTVWKSPRSEDPTAQPQMGVWVELASPERVRKLVLETPTPGMGVEIYATRAPNVPDSITHPDWVHLTDRSDLPARATIPIPGKGRYRYVLVWIRNLAPGTDRAEISEIEAIGLAP